MPDPQHGADVNDRHHFESFFRDATGFSPYEWQISLALDGLPEVLTVPTGLGKTEGAVLSWAWRQLIAGLDEPMHLVYCLPMRSLVSQTLERLNQCFDSLASKRKATRTPVYQLMGGAIDEEWSRWPDQPWVLVGTQDQLLSRALNRGYAMSRFEWPVHFGLLNQDCRWIIDEVQLMGPGLWTTAQLDWMRQKRFRAVKKCATTWMSATVGMSFLSTTDRKKDGIDTVTPWDAQLDGDPKLQRRLAARRPISWFRASTAKGAKPLHEQIAFRAVADHESGTLTLVICNTVQMAQAIFRELPDAPPKILLTSRFRKIDRNAAERKLFDFEKRRGSVVSGRIEGDPGLICVSTQVIEAGVDISSHHLWSELAPWPSMIQRLGRLNRDGRDPDAQAHVWGTPKSEEKKRDGDVWIGPYRKRDLDNASMIVNAVGDPSASMSFVDAVKAIEPDHRELLHRVLQPEPTPLPRAFDVHGLFSTERDLHGGFTDVSAFVRGSDLDADATVFWRQWTGDAPPRGDQLDGPPSDPEQEACAVPDYRLAEFLKTTRSRGWVWDEEEGEWHSIAPDWIRPGMFVMIRRDVGGYNGTVGWTGQHTDVLAEAPRPGPARALRDDERTETGYWSRLPVHLSDARAEAERIADAVGLTGDVRIGVIEAAGLHDLGKAHPKWQAALPAGGALDGSPWAKCPRVLAVDARAKDGAIREAVDRMRPGALALTDEARRGNRVRLRWAVGQQLRRAELEELRSMPGVDWAGHAALRSGMRHEAASALAMWYRYREGRAEYPALAVYLAAAHHGKVRTVLRSTIPDGDDVFGVERQPEVLELDGDRWILDFSVAGDGAAGEWQDGQYVMTGHGWTGLVADLLGPWRSDEDDSSEVSAVPENEPRRLGPFVLSWLEALVRVADWRASEAPSQCVKPEEVLRNE